MTRRPGWRRGQYQQSPQRSVEYYLKKADDCEKRAEEASDEIVAENLRQLAEHWRREANRRIE